MKVKREFLRFGTFKVKDGTQVRFWEDKWQGNATLCEQYPCLYSIARHKQHTLSEVLSSSPINISWRRDLIDNKLAAWNSLYPCIANITLSQGKTNFTGTYILLDSSQ
jgi:hypothetical protein